MGDEMNFRDYLDFAIRFKDEYEKTELSLELKN